VLKDKIAYAFGSTFAFLPTAQSQTKIQKSYQANAPQQPDRQNND
jgi:hypothetical protein